MKLRNLIGPSPVLYLSNRFQRRRNKDRGENASIHLAATGYVDYGDRNGQCFADEEFEFENYEWKKPDRMSDGDVRKLYAKNAKLTRQQRLLKSVLDEAAAHSPKGQIPYEALEKMKDAYEFRKKYGKYLFAKRIIPVGVLTPFTGTELGRMFFAQSLGMNSVSFTVGSYLGFAIPSFLFFHMAYYFAYDKFKPVCLAGKWTFGLPFILMSEATDKLLPGSEESVYGEDIPMDVTQTGGTIPFDIGDLNKVLEEMKDFFPEKTYFEK